MSDLVKKVKELEKSHRRADALPSPTAPQTARVIQLPLWPDARRGLPNSLARSSLFCVQARGKTREYLKNAVVASLGKVEIAYTGEQLRQDDEDVFLQLTHLARVLPLGEAVEFSAYSMLKSLKWPRTGNNHYERLKTCIQRLKANALTITDGNRGYSGSLIRSFEWAQEDGTPSRTWKIWLEPKIIPLFEHVAYTQIDWEQRMSLGPLAKWMHSFYHSHARPYPLKLTTIHGLCGSETKAMYSFRQGLRKALKELVACGFIESGYVDDDDLVQVERVKLPRTLA